MKGKQQGACFHPTMVLSEHTGTLENDNEEAARVHFQADCFPIVRKPHGSGYDCHIIGCRTALVSDQPFYFDQDSKFPTLREVDAMTPWPKTDHGRADFCVVLEH
jgi:hypothetical protein